MLAAARGDGDEERHQTRVADVAAVKAPNTEKRWPGLESRDHLPCICRRPPAIYVVVATGYLCMKCRHGSCTLLYTRVWREIQKADGNRQKMKARPDQTRLIHKLPCRVARPTKIKEWESSIDPGRSQCSRSNDWMERNLCKIRQGCMCCPIPLSAIYRQSWRDLTVNAGTS